MTTSIVSTSADAAVKPAWIALVVVAFSTALVVVVCHAGFLLSNDGPVHAFGWYARAHASDPLFAPFLEPNPMITSRGLPELFAAFDAWLGWRAAFVAVCAACALSYALAFFAVVVAVDVKRWPIGLVGFAAALQHGFYLGLLEYLAGSALGLFAIAWWLRRRRRVVDFVVLAALLYASASVHPFAAALAGVTCVAIAFVDVEARLRRLAGLAIAGVPALAIAVLSADVVPAPRDDAPASLLSPQLAHVIADHVAVVTAFVPGPAWRGAVLWLAAIGAAVSVAIAAARSARRRRARDDVDAPSAPRSLAAPDPHAVALAVVGSLLLVAALALPRDAGGWQLAALRPLPFAAPLLLALVDVGGARRARVVAGVAAVGYTVATLAWTIGFHAQLEQAYGPVVDAVSSLRPAPALRGAIAPPIPAPVDVPYLEPYRHLAQLAAVKLGGVTAYSYIGRGTDAVRVRGALPHVPTDVLDDRAPDAQSADRARYVRRLAALNTTAGDVVVVGPAADLDVVEAAGFTASQRIDGAVGILVAHFDGCSAHVNATGHVDVGFAPMKDAVGHVDVTAGENVVGLGCGPMWFRFSVACAEADSGGRVFADLSRDRVADVPCTPR